MLPQAIRFVQIVQQVIEGQKLNITSWDKAFCDKGGMLTPPALVEFKLFKINFHH